MYNPIQPPNLTHFHPSMRPKHTPQRTCVACRTTGDKRGLLRVVRQPDGVVDYDPTGKANGRGAYVCAAEPCIKLAQKQNKLGRSLKANISPDLFDLLLEQAQLAITGAP